MFKHKLASTLLTIVFFSFLSLQLLAQSKDVIKENFYKAMSSTDLSLIETELDKLEKLGAAAELAYKGALIMKKAGLLDKVGDKLETFKKGKGMLEKAIAAKPNNAEFRFLRLMIQENAPSVLGYSNNIKEDANIIDEKFHELSTAAKDAVVEYSKKSKTLNTEG